MADFYCCDTLHVVRACEVRVADGCARIQCLARCCACAGGGCAHRALEDTVVRSVVRYCADAVGVTVAELPTPFACKFDVYSIILARSLVA